MEKIIEEKRGSWEQRIEKWIQEKVSAILGEYEIPANMAITLITLPSGAPFQLQPNGSVVVTPSGLWNPFEVPDSLGWCGPAGSGVASGPGWAYPSSNASQGCLLAYLSSAYPITTSSITAVRVFTSNNPMLICGPGYLYFGPNSYLPAACGGHPQTCPTTNNGSIPGNQGQLGVKVVTVN